MEAYLRHLFSLYGVKKQLLKKPILEHQNELSHENIIPIVTSLYRLPKRELHYCAIELADKFLKKKYEIKDLGFIKNLIVTNSWWDSVDFIAKHILGNYLLQFPNKIKSVVTNFSSSENMRLNRSAILFQLGYKDNADATLLFDICKNISLLQNFLIRKQLDGLYENILKLMLMKLSHL